MNPIYPELTPLVIGSSRDYDLQVIPPSGTPYDSSTTPFDGTEMLAAKVCLGVDQPSVASPSVAWADPQTGRYTVSFGDGDALGMVPGEYVLQATAARAGRTASLIVAYLPVRQVGGTAAAIPVYGSLDDLRLYCAWIDRMEHPSRRAQFLRERGRARTWFDQLLQRHWRASGYGISTLGFPIGGIGPFRTGGQNKWLQDQLDADTLMVTDDIRELLAKKALGYALEYQVGSRDETSYQELAAAFHAEADLWLAPDITAGLDLNADGWPDLVIDLSTADTLMA